MAAKRKDAPAAINKMDSPLFVCFWLVAPATDPASDKFESKL
jgi:hypothetical protein